MTLDPTQAGKQHGHLIMPYTDHAGQAQWRVPVCSIRGHKSGPTVVMISGIHGDEYDGPLALHRMARVLDADLIHGCLLIVSADSSCRQWARTAYRAALLGCEVWRGDILARLVDLESTGSQPQAVAVLRNGILLAMHHGGRVMPGDLLAILADEVQR